jgi:hypothetical protein
VQDLLNPFLSSLPDRPLSEAVNRYLARPSVGWMEIGDVEKGGAPLTDIDESGLDGGLDVDDPPEIDIPEATKSLQVLLVILPERPIIVDESHRQGVTVSRMDQQSHR